jgi:hypothetical protein
MIAVSNAFKQAMKQPVKELDAYIQIAENDRITSADDLIQFKVSCDSGLCKTAMRKLEAKYLGDRNLLGQWVHVGFGVKLTGGTFEYLDYGSFLVTEITYTKDTGVTTITGYDKMIMSMKNYVKMGFDYPMSLYDYTKQLCMSFGLNLGNESFETHNNWQVTQELWENIDGITYRDILVQIAQVTCSTCMIGNDDSIYFKNINETDETLTYDNMKKLKLEPIYGEINSVVLSRTPQEDNIYMRDDQSIGLNGLTEWKIENNEIIDKDRDNAMTPIYNAMHGIKYYPFETTTEGLGWYEIADNLDIINDVGDVFNTTLFNFSITIDGGIKETLKTVAETKTQTQYQYATTIAKRVKNTEIIVNKQEQYIENLVTDMYEEDGLVHENFTTIHQDIENIVNSVQNSGGNNLIKNSVMFAFDNDNIPNNWTVEGEGTLNIGSSAEALNSGSVSGHTFTLLDKKVSQKVIVKLDTDDIPADEKTYYTFSTKIKKDATGSCYVRLYNSNEEYRIDLGAGESSFYGDYEIKALLPKDTYYIIEFYGSADSNATFTDNMLAVGNYKTQWTQASGEIMNTQVNINLDGVLVKSSIYLGDYTVMSPLEFAGYSKINGSVTKVFSLNKDTTVVKKLKAEDEVKMVPIKIVPVTTGDLQGWAFVPTSS